MALRSRMRSLLLQKGFWPLPMAGLLVGAFLFSLLLGQGWTGTVLMRPGEWVSDVLVTYWPNGWDIHREWQHTGRLLLWRPRMFAGWSAVGDPQTGLAYPPALLVLVLPPTLVFHLLLWAHLGLAAWGMERLARAVGLRPATRGLLLVATALYPRFYAQWGLGHLSLVYAAAYVPAILALTYRLVREPAPHRWMVLGALLGLQAVNHVQIMLYTMSVAVGVYGYTQFGGRTPFFARTHALFGWMLALCTASLVAAPLALPLVRNLPLLARRAFTPQEVAIGASTLRDWLSLMFPHYRWAYADTLFYLGFPLLTLLWYARRDPQARFWMALAGLGLLYAVLPSWPWGADILSRIPLLNRVRGAGRVWFALFPLLLLAAGRGLELRLQTPGRALLARRMEPLLLGLFLLVGGYAWRYGPPPGYWLGATLGATAAWALARWVFPHPQWRPRTKTALTLLVVALDLGVFSHSLLEARPLQAFFGRERLVAFLRERREHLGLFRTYSPTYSLPQHLAAYANMETADGVDPLYPALYDRFMQAAAGVPRPHYTVTVPYLHDPGPGPVYTANRNARPHPCLLGLANVRYVLAPYPLSVRRLEPVERLDGVWIYENRCFRDRAYLVGHTFPVDNPEQALDWVQGHPEEVGLRAAVVGGRPMQAPLWSRIQWVTYHNDQVTLDVETRHGGFLLLSMNYHPDWQARVNGRPTPLYRADGPFMGLYLGPGRHRVELRFVPRTFFLGWGGHLLGWLLVLTFTKRHNRAGRLNWARERKNA